MATKFLGLYDLDTSDGDETYLGLNSSGIVKRFPKPEGSLGKTSLTANTTYFVNVTTGSNANDGKTSGTAWQTFAYALEWLGRNIDLAGWTLELKLADGVHDGFSTNGDQHAWITGGYFWIHGNDTNPENVILRGTTWEAFGCGPGATFFISDMKVESTATMVLISIGTMILGRPEMGGYGGRLLIGRSQGAAWAWLLNAYENGSIADLTSGGIEIDTAGVSCAGIASAYQGGLIYLNAPIRINANLTALDAVFKATQNGVIEMFGVPTLADGVTVTGKKYDLHTGGQIRRNLATQNLDQLPGTVSGTIKGYKEKLSTDRTYYVRTDGSNNNNGLANTTGGAWATLQYALDFICDFIELNDCTITVQLGATGTVYSGFTFGRSISGSGHIQILGTTNNTDYEIDNSGGNLCPIYLVNQGRLITFWVGGVKLSSSSYACIYVGNSKLRLGSMSGTFPAPRLGRTGGGLFHQIITDGALSHIQSWTAGLTIDVDTTATPVAGLVSASDNALVQLGGISFAAPVTHSSETVQATNGAYVQINSADADAGVVTGKKYTVNTGGTVRRAGTLGIDNIPGTIAGTWLVDSTNLRVKATGPVTFYVNSSTGNDTTGTGTVGLPWATPAKAIAEAGKIDGNGQTLTIDLADGSYGAIFGDGQQIRGWSSILFDGNATTPTNVQITAYSPFYNGIQVTVQGMTLAPGSGWFALEAQTGARIIVTDCALGNCAYGFVTQLGGMIRIYGGSFTLTLAGTISDYLFYAIDGGHCYLSSFVYINAGATYGNWFYVARGGTYTRGLGGSNFLRAGSAPATGGRGVIGRGGIVGHQVNLYPDPGTSGPTYEADATGIYNDEIKTWRSYNTGTVGMADYERLSSGWSSNVFKLSTGALGTGVNRDIAINAGESAHANVLLQTGEATRFTQSRRSLVLTPDESLSTTDIGLKLSHTWNAAATTHTAFQIEATLTAGNPQSFFASWRKTADRAGAGTFTFQSDGYLNIGLGHNTASDKAISIYRFWDGGSNWDGARFGFNGGVFEIATLGGGTGTASSIYMRTGATNVATLNPTGVALTPATATLATDKALKIAQTWNSTADLTAIDVDITHTASGVNSLLFSIKQDGIRKLDFSRTGDTLAHGAGNTTARNTQYIQYYFWDGGANFEGGSIGWESSAYTIKTFKGGTGVDRSIIFKPSSVQRGRYEAAGLVLTPSASHTPTNNGELTVEATSNTTLTFRLKGSDGVVRSATLTLT